MRIYDASFISDAVDFYLGKGHNEDPILWISDPKHIALMNDHGDLALFEPRIKNNYSGHYFFRSRGRAAITAGKQFLDELFNTCYNISTLTGFTPLDNKPARWMSRQLGFKSYGEVSLDNMNFELFILTKEEFNR